MDIFSSLRKFGPFAILAGYIGFYATTAKGIGSIVPDLKNISLARLQLKWQNFAIAIGAFIVIQLLPKLKLPATIKTIVVVVLYAIIGYQLALAIDPPGTRYTNIEVPRTYNQYFTKARGG
jgi:hypothetical protein